MAGEERVFVEKFATLENERNVTGIREEQETAEGQVVTELVYTNVVK